jgi:serine protease AprX
MSEITLPWKHRAVIIPFLAFILLSPGLDAQRGGFNYYYRVYFRDKGTSTPSDFSPSSLLSEKAIKRREKSGIVVPDYRDLPVWSEYLDKIKSMGYTLHCTSKWMNSALFKTGGPADQELLLSLPYVESVKLVKKPAGKSPWYNKLDFTEEKQELPPFDRQITLVNGYPLHNSGFTGNGVLIAVLDGGFLYADEISSLENLRSRKGIKATKDFVDNDGSVYEYHNHGTAVLSVLAGQLPGVIEGTAPGADFILLRTEDIATESSAEEDYWAAGAEFADSAGADIISSSLGYCTFDDASSSYKYSDLDGNTTFVTRAADAAASKGILVVNSAGNERTKEWKRIIAPSDGESVISVGAVDGYGTIAAFSSAGPSYDGRIKPDNQAMGVSVTVQASLTGVSRSNGTSFSCPVLSGMAACLLQAVPGAANNEVIEAIHSAGDRFNSPDSLYGYGIPDMVRALEIVQNNHLVIPGSQSIVCPNPTTGEFEIIFREPPDEIYIEIFTSSGVIIFRKNFGESAGRSLRISALNDREQGMYLVRLTTKTGTFTQKIIKLRN